MTSKHQTDAISSRTTVETWKKSNLFEVFGSIQKRSHLLHGPYNYLDEKWVTLDEALKNEAMKKKPRRCFPEWKRTESMTLKGEAR